MLSQIDKKHAMLALYRSEKEAAVDPLDDDGSFPSFKEWCSQVESERQPGDYRTVTVEQADEEMEAVLVEVDNQPQATETATKESEEMNNVNDGTQPTTEPAATETTTPAATAPKAKRVRKPAAQRVAKAKTKSEICRSIFKRMSRGKTLNREKIIAAFVAEAKLSPKGAATYYQTIKGKGGKKAA